MKQVYLPPEAELIILSPSEDITMELTDTSNVFPAEA